MMWDSSLTALRDILADLYPTVGEARRVLMDAGLNSSAIAGIAFSPGARLNWHSILVQADKHDAIPNIVEVAGREYPKQRQILSQAVKGVLGGIKGVDIQDDVKWRGKRDIPSLEAIIGAQNTLLPISFLEIGLERARSVGRVVRPDAWIGTGVLISDSVLLTNYHVLDETTAKGAVVQFNYQMSATGLAAPIAEFQVDSETLIATSPEDDWTIVHVRGAPGKTWGKLALQPVEIREGDFVNIIQHAAGLPKQIALYHNVVVHADDSRVQYLTDTLPGSSGSPVFNSKWQVVALHHSGGWLTEPGSQHEFWRNEGININAVIRGLIRKNAYPTP